MCTNDRPTSRELLYDYFGAPAPELEFREEAYPGYQVPIIWLAHEDGETIKRMDAQRFPVKLTCVSVNFAR